MAIFIVQRFHSQRMALPTNKRSQNRTAMRAWALVTPVGNSGAIGHDTLDVYVRGLANHSGFQSVLTAFTKIEQATPQLD
jgi:hypothetical protein